MQAVLATHCHRGTQESRAFATEQGLLYFETSARTGAGVVPMFEDIGPCCLLLHPVWRTVHPVMCLDLVFVVVPQPEECPIVKCPAQSLCLCVQRHPNPQLAAIVCVRYLLTASVPRMNHFPVVAVSLLPTPTFWLAFVSGVEGSFFGGVFPAV
jgi:hypothetical protein